MGRSSRPLDKGGRSPKKFFSVLRASVWSRNKGIRHWYFLKLPKRNGANRLISNRNFQFSHVNSKHPWAHTPLILSSSLDALNTEPLEDLQWAESKCETLVLGFLLPFRIISCLSEDTIMTLTRSFICIHLCGNTVSEMLTRNSVGSRTWDKKGGGGGGGVLPKTLHDSDDPWNFFGCVCTMYVLHCLIVLRLSNTLWTFK